MVIKDCYEKNQQGHPQFKSLTSSMKSHLRATVGELYWEKAGQFLNLYFQQTKSDNLSVETVVSGKRAAEMVEKAATKRKGSLPKKRGRKINNDDSSTSDLTT
jgi:hypothetical protein